MSTKTRIYPNSVAEQVRTLMLDGRWRSSHKIREILIARGVYATDVSITGRLRDLRHLGYSVECRRVGGKQFSYRVKAIA